MVVLSSVFHESMQLLISDLSIICSSLCSHMAPFSCGDLTSKFVLGINFSDKHKLK